MTRQARIRLTLAFLGLVVMITAQACPGCRQDPDKLVLGLVAPSSQAYPGGPPQGSADALAKAISRELGIKIEVFPFSSVADLTRSLGAGQVDIAVSNPFAYVAARKAVGAQVIFKCVTADRVSTRSQIIAPASSDLRDIGDLKGKVVGFVDPSSAWGYLFPAAYLVENGVIPNRDLAQVVFLGDEASVVKAVLEGRVEAGASSEGALAMVRQEIPDVQERIIVIASTPPVPGTTVSVRPGLEAELVDRIKQALLAAVNDDEGRVAWKVITGTDGLVEAQDQEYDVIRDMTSILGLDVEVLAGS